MHNFPYPVSHLSAPVTPQANVDQKIHENRQQLNEVMHVMRHNIGMMSERCERLNKLASRAEVLDMSACTYQKTAYQVRESRIRKSLPQIVLGIMFIVCVVSGVGYALF